MSVDPKFANLPWIAHDEPDVYESCDLPESDQRLVENMDEEQVLPKEIEKVNLSASEAQKRFVNSKVNADGIDFSGDFISGNVRIGYTIESSEYEAPGTGSSESLTQRFQRLQVEVQQLISDSEEISRQVRSDSSDPITARQLTQLSSTLRDQLNALHLDEIFGPEADIDLTSQENLLKKRLLDQINNFKPQEKSKDQKPTDHIIYDLYSKPSQKDEAKNAKIIELDKRIQRMESLLGHPEPTLLSTLTADTMGNGLLEATKRLASRSALFQPGHLDQIESRLASLQTRLQEITEKREIIADADSHHKIAELYELVKKWHSVSTDLPQVVDRLNDLQSLHEQASEFCSALANMEHEQKRIDQDLVTFGSLLNQVQGSVAEAMTTIKENISLLAERTNATSK